MRKTTDCRQCKYMQSIFPNTDSVYCRKVDFGNGSIEIRTVIRSIPKRCPYFRATEEIIKSVPLSRDRGLVH